MDFAYFAEQMSQDKLLVLAFPLFIIVMLLEMWYDRKEQLDLYHGMDTWASISMAVASAIVEIVPKLLLFILIY